MSKELWMWLAAGLGWGAVNSGELLAAFPGGAAQVAQELGSPLIDEILTQKQGERLASTRPEDYAIRLAHAATQGIEALPFDDPLYPDNLRNIANPPAMLFVKGDASLLNGQLTIAMVGARRPSAYGVEATQAIGRGIALGGAIIVSGLAAGLDAEAHKAALAVNGPTIACIAFGHDTCYPASNRKLMEVIEHTGAVVSEYPLGTGAEKPYFLQRNRIIAGLCHGLVVAEARKQSGTMSTVNFASEYGRDVFAIPGSIFSELSGGTNALIREGAFLAGSATDVLSVYGVELQAEDPVAAAARQAEQGRPSAAAATPVWQQSLAKASAREDLRPQPAPSRPAATEREQPWQKTLAEALQQQIYRDAGDEEEHVTSQKAIEAFRQLQELLPPVENGGAGTRDPALDERAAKVADSLELERDAGLGATRGMRPGREDENSKVKPFRWDKVEHLSKKEMQRQAEAAQAQEAARRQAAQARPVAPAASAQPVGRVERVDRVSRVEPVAPAAPVLPAKAATPAAEQQYGGLPPGQEAIGGEGPGPALQNGAAPAESKRKAPVLPAPALPAPPGRPPGDKGGGGILPPAAPTAKPFGNGSARAAGRAAYAEALSGRLRAEENLEEVEADFWAKERPVPEAADEASAAAAPQAPPGGAAAAEARPAPPLAENLPEEPDELDGAGDPLAGVSENARKAFRQLGVKPVPLSAITEGSGLKPGEAMAALTELELAGLSRQLAGRQFVIMQ